MCYNKNDVSKRRFLRICGNLRVVPRVFFVGASGGIVLAIGRSAACGRGKARGEFRPISIFVRFDTMSTKKAVKKNETALVAVEEEDTITIPLLDIFRQLKKYLLLWILIAVVAAGLVFSGSLIMYNSSATPMTAMVGFYYDGIELGLDPNGNEFDANSMKAPTVIESTLTELGLPLEDVDTYRSSLVISGVVPEDTIDEMTAYRSIFESDYSIDAAKELMNVSYYPTTFEVEFNYAQTSLDRSEAANFLNTLLSNYKTYFLQTYGSNELFGTTLSAVDYAGYDYPQAVDLFASTLSSLQSYVNSLEDEDDTAFRSTVTGYSFSDLAEAASTLKSIDLTAAYSYVLGNNVTRDKDALIDYYEYQIETLTRSLTAAQDKLDSIQDSIDNYQKDSIVIMSGSDGTTDTTLTQTSEAYDALITQKIDAQASVSNYQKQIDEYETRLSGVKKTAVGTAEEQEEADAELEALCTKLNELSESVNETATDYFETVSLANAYSVLVPASSSTSSAISNAISHMKRPLLIAEALLFVIYLAFAVVRAFIVSYRRDNLKKAAEADADADTDAEVEAVPQAKK